MFRFRHLQTRIIFLVIALALLLSLMLGVINSYGDYRSVQDQVNDLVSQSSSSSGLAIENYLDTLEQEIKTMAASGALTAAALTHEQRQENLNAILRARPDISGLYTIGRDGVSINDSDYTFEDSSGEDYGEEDFFLSAIAADGIWIDDPVYDEWTDNISLTITYRFNDGAGFDGVIGLDIHYKVLLGIVEQGAVGDTGYTILVAEDGRIITHPDENFVLDEVNYLEDTQSQPDFTAALSVILGPDDGLIDNVRLDGESVRLYHHAISQTGWALVTIAKPAEFMSGFYDSLRATLITVGVCLLLSVLIALFIGRSIARPVRLMTERMRLFADGDLHTGMPPVRSKDELGVLHQSLSESIRVLNSYVVDISHTLERISSGDVTGRIELDYQGDFRPIRDNLNIILQSLNRVMGSITSSARDVSTTSTQMASAAQSLSETTIYQAGTVDSLNQSFGVIRQGLEQTAADTTTALDKTSLARQALDDCRSRMDDMMAAMKEVDGAAASIEKIIKSIDDIAFQTNILALNAAVEAARAGQHGKGFAVVAEEVRSLASKSAESARQTAVLIQNTLKAINSGSATAEQASSRLGGVDSLVGEVTNLVRGIESEANTQSESANAIHQALDQLNNSVQNNSAMAEQTAASSQELNNQADSLHEALGFFSLDNAQAALPGRPRDGLSVEAGHPGGEPYGKY